MSIDFDEIILKLDRHEWLSQAEHEVVLKALDSYRRNPFVDKEPPVVTLDLPPHTERILREWLSQAYPPCPQETYQKAKDAPKTWQESKGFDPRPMAAWSQPIDPTIGVGPGWEIKVVPRSERPNPPYPTDEQLKKDLKSLDQLSE